MLTATGSAVAVVGGPVATTPASYTPWLPKTVLGQYVQQLVPCGDTMYAVGKISTVQQGSTTYTRANAFSFSASTGAMRAWAPQVVGTVNSVALSPDCSTAYLGGVFTSVNGVTVKNLVAVNTSTGAVLTGFAHTANGAVETLQYTRGVILAGGAFTKINGTNRSRLASLNPTTGAATSYAKVSITGGYPKSPTPKIHNSQLNHAGTKLLVEGVFTSVGGAARQQVAVLDLNATSVTVDPWNAPELNVTCSANSNYFAKGANWSPDDSTIYVAATGYKPVTGPGSSKYEPRGGPCDSLMAFAANGGTVSHTWINYTGCDSLYDVAADASTVYVGGHERYADNPLGCDGAGPGAVSRPGIGGIDPVSGMATAWNPTRSRGRGVNDLVVTPAGLWVASDNGTTKSGASEMCGRVTDKGGICFLPY